MLFSIPGKDTKIMYLLFLMMTILPIRNVTSYQAIMTTSANAETIGTATDLNPPLYLVIGSTSTEIYKQSSIEDQYYQEIQILELVRRPTTYPGFNKLQPEILCLNTVFSYLLTNNIINIFRDQTNLYSVQREASKPINVIG